MFFPSGWFTPVLPPTEESTMAMTVVGTCSIAVISRVYPKQGCQAAGVAQKQNFISLRCGAVLHAAVAEALDKAYARAEMRT